MTAVHPDPGGRRSRQDQGVQGGQVFLNSEYGALQGPLAEGCRTAATSTPLSSDSSY